MSKARALDGWDKVWADIQSDQQKCTDLKLPWADLQRLRALKIGQTNYSAQCTHKTSADNKTHTCVSVSVRLKSGKMGDSCSRESLDAAPKVDPAVSGQANLDRAIITDTCPPRDAKGNLLDSTCDALNCKSCASATSGGSITGCEPPPPPPLGPFSVTLPTSIGDIGTEWRAKFAADVGGLLNVAANRIIIISIEAGSVVVSFKVKQSATKLLSVAEVKNALPAGVTIAAVQSLTAVSDTAIPEIPDEDSEIPDLKVNAATPAIYIIKHAGSCLCACWSWWLYPPSSSCLAMHADSVLTIICCNRTTVDPRLSSSC